MWSGEVVGQCQGAPLTGRAVHMPVEDGRCACIRMYQKHGNRVGHSSPAPRPHNLLVATYVPTWATTGSSESASPVSYSRSSTFFRYSIESAAGGNTRELQHLYCIVTILGQVGNSSSAAFQALD